MPRLSKKHGRAILRAAVLSLFVFGGILGSAAILHPDTPLPDHWNPTRPLQVAAPVTILTEWKLSRASADPAACLKALQPAAPVQSQTPFHTSDPNCQVDVPVTIGSVGKASMVGLETNCATALRLAMWEHHSLQPAATSAFGAHVSRILDQGSYNCRPIRTASGNSGRWSTHATADAVDVRGFRLSNGEQVILLRDWTTDGTKADFLREVQQGACRWFKTTLGPDYNALHADHFHLQSRGWGTCR